MTRSPKTTVARLFNPKVLLRATPTQHTVANQLIGLAQRPGPGEAPGPEYELLQRAMHDGNTLLQDAAPLVAAMFAYRGCNTPLTEEQRTAVLQEVLMLRRACEVVGLDLAIQQLGPTHEEAEQMLAEVAANVTHDEAHDEAPDIAPPAPRPVFDANGEVVSDA